MMLVQQFLEGTAARIPQKIALVCGDRRVTYAELDSLSDRLATALAESGIRRGDRVGIYLGNSLEAAVGIFAVLKAGGVFVMIHPSTKRDKLNYILNNCGAKALLADVRGAAHAWLQSVVEQNLQLQLAVICGENSGAAGSPFVPCLRFDDIQTFFPAERRPATNIDVDLACLIYTSGTTGEPKGVMCDHSNMIFVSDSVMQYLEISEDDVVLSVLPMAYSYGLYQLLMTVWSGGTLILENSFAFPAGILQRLERERVTAFPAVPAIFAAMLQMDLSRFDLSALRYVTNAAAALPVSHIQEFRRRLPWVKLFSMHGLTEVKRTLYLPPGELESKPGSVGIPIPGTEAWLEDESRNRLPSGQTGELVIRGRHVMRGYWGDPAATAERFVSGPLPGERVCRTGDLFRTDEEGYFYFVARKDDIIKCRGEKVAPKEVETVLYTLEGVVEAAVVGVPDPMFGQAIKALLVVRGRRLTVAQVRAYCQERLEDFMVPSYVEFLSELPKTSSGKIARRELAGVGASDA